MFQDLKGVASTRLLYESIIEDFNRELKEDVVDLLVEGKDKEAKKIGTRGFYAFHILW